MLTVVKLGGGAAADPRALRATGEKIAAIPGWTAVVHGGGAEISAWQQRLGLSVEWRDGLRVTTPEGMQVAAMVLSGWVNKRIVQVFQDAGLPAVGLSGEDGALLLAERAAGGSLGEVGSIVGVQPDVVYALLSAGFVPVVSPVSRGPGGAPLNVNADEAALHLAAGLGATRIYLISDVPGVLVDGNVSEALTVSDARGLLARGVATGGMTVKLRQALVAAEAGVEVAIGGPELLDDFTAGTRILAAELPAEVA